MSRLPALALANKERSAYGLRYNDFARYRKHCANKVHRLRSTLKLTHGKGKSFKKLPEFTADSVKGTTYDHHYPHSSLVTSFA
jgi:signal recognition particle subunit SRP68